MLPVFMIKKNRKISTLENETYLKVQTWFFSYPNSEISLSDLSKRVRISKTTANKVVLHLEKEGFLKKAVLGKMWWISCNQNHFYNYSRKIAYNLEMIYKSKVLELIHSAVKSPRAIILFGSYRKGDDNERSDVDIAVEILGDEELRIIKLGTMPHFGYRYDVPVNIHIFSRNKIDLNLFANIANGIVLEGFLEVRP